MRLLEYLACMTFLVACGASSTVDAPGNGEGGSGGDGGTASDGGGDTCGGNTCDANERCYEACEGFPQTECGFGNITCSEHDMGACGCDGNAYATLCDMDQAGVRQGTADSCVPPTGQYACDGLLCRIADQQCVVSGGTPYCHGLDNTTCSDCSCIDVSAQCFSGGTCTDVSGGGVVIACN